FTQTLRPASIARAVFGGPDDTYVPAFAALVDTRVNRRQASFSTGRVNPKFDPFPVNAHHYQIDAAQLVEMIFEPPDDGLNLGLRVALADQIGSRFNFRQPHVAQIRDMADHIRPFDLIIIDQDETPDAAHRQGQRYEPAARSQPDNC